MQTVILDFYGVIFDPNTRLPTTGVEEFLMLIQEHGLTCAIASSSDTRSIQEFLNEYELAGYFQTVIGGDKVSALKPDPECYVQAAEELGVALKNCVVIDDSLAPLEQAKLLGFQIIHFSNTQADFSVIAKLLKLQ